MRADHEQRRANRENGLQRHNFFPGNMDMVQKATICEIQKEFANLFEKYRERLPKGRYLSKTIGAIEDASIYAQKAIEYDYVSQPEIEYK